MPFNPLGLSESVLQGVLAAGYTQPSPVQSEAIPVILKGRDVIVSAQTGTGKTAAFALPLLTRLQRHGKCRCLILEPTRELAAQVATAIRNYSKFTDLKEVLIHGGVGYPNQVRALRSGVDIVVATPGRLEDHMQKRNVHLNDIEILVLDEVDRMLDMGFLPAVRRIVSRCPASRQTLFFSATIPKLTAELAKFSLRDPVRIEIGVNRSVSVTIKHALYPVSQSRKVDLLKELLRETGLQSVLIFTRTRRGADRVARALIGMNHRVAVLHADRSQNQRTEALQGFKTGKYKIMVATDIASRGIDVAGVTHVINYDIPEHPEDYVHRIGRTGRAQKDGDAFTLVTPADDKHVRSIEKFIGKGIPRLKLPGFQDGMLSAIPAAHPSSTRRPPKRQGQFSRWRGRGRGSSSPRGGGGRSMR